MGRRSHSVQHTTWNLRIKAWADRASLPRGWKSLCTRCGGSEHLCTPRLQCRARFFSGFSRATAL
ncbi:hypothetical protein BD626DRAFT_492315 [Schizophyllum amplum]|uniref:Uncharacterized protein n=1 Tax=Schizophyllum amplum TaxID=97359 RepID=A0A550CIE7_9AGAR|nr:hypothetical protein BD626DRAFT_492315 [Auriculariopsis ampla]